MSGVVVCHGSSLVRERFATAAAGLPALTPVRTAGSAEELLVLARRRVPALLLLDAHLPGVGPIEAIRRLRMMSIEVPIVMLASPGDEIALDRAIALGARGFVAPDVGRAELAALVAHLLPQAVGVPASRGGAGAAGGSSAWAPGQPAQPGQVGAAAGAGRSPVPEPGMRSAAEAMSAVQPAADLTKREMEVLVGMSRGLSNSQIASALYLSDDTVKTHARRLFRKLGAADRAQAVAMGLRRGLIA